MAKTLEFETLLYEVEDGVATLTLNRPERRNSFTRQMAEELQQAWSAIKSDPEVVCTILTGAGEKALCTGMDIADVASGEVRKGDSMKREDVPKGALHPRRVLRGAMRAS